jgi:hypothetical protein
VKKRFKVEITSPCGRADHDGGEAILYTRTDRFFGTRDFIASFQGAKELRDGDEVEVTIEVIKPTPRSKDGT